MNTDKKMTVAQWDSLEKEKLADLQAAKNKLKDLNVSRGVLLLSIGEGMEGKKELEDLEKNIRDCHIEIDATQALLAAVPQRRDVSRSQELEITINQVENFDLRLAELAKVIDDAIEKLVLAVREYYNVLEDLYKININTFNFRFYDLGVLNALGAVLRKHDLWKYIKVGVFRDAQVMTEAPSRIHARIAVTLNTMRNHVKELRREGALSKDICRECYGHMNLNQYTQERTCTICGSRGEE